MGLIDGDMVKVVAESRSWTTNRSYTMSSAFSGFTVGGLSSISAVTTGSPNMEDKYVCIMISSAERQSYIHLRAVLTVLTANGTYDCFRREPYD